jgi:hypothetical protein
MNIETDTTYVFLILALWVGMILAFSYFLLRFIRLKYSEVMFQFWQRQAVKGNVTRANRYYWRYRLLGLVLAMVTIIIWYGFGASLATNFLLVAGAVVLLLAILSIPSAIKNYLRWYRNLTKTDKRIYDQLMMRGFLVGISGLVVCGVALVTLRYLPH